MVNLQAVSYLSTAVWAYLELFQGRQRVPATSRTGVRDLHRDSLGVALH